ncbi:MULTISPECIES: glycosyltransferase family 25 protein [Colwellia]|jgi:glycosyl transferase family 25|uniref:glycosyltransferase family 25 protein n=1 Tax=Colwellia TaxID=28228 RepID=UPI000A16FA59|nr:MULTISPECIES: glycosyltransferase family 25 protein [Colwellia]AWB58637.1 glycosyl transferase family 25 [Colwellia sp. Arc7-D]MBA6416308.1 glycosyltransferase family 25 protein [Colwellia sp. 6M3]
MSIINNCPVYVINLDCATERLLNMDKQLSEINVAFERIPAVKGNNLTTTEINQEYSKILNKKYFRADLSMGEIGCYISHRNVWRKMVAENIAFAVILEDDMNIESNFIQLFSLSETLSKYDLIKLADNRNHEPKQISSLDQQFELINFTKIPNCATGYTLNLAGAKKLLARDKFYRPVDIDMQFCQELDLSVFGLRPYPISENKNFASDITLLNGGFHGTKSTNFIRNIKYRIHLWYLRKTHLSGEL